MVLRGISIDAHNDNNDFDVAKRALRLALGVVHDKSLKTRMLGDMESIEASLLIHAKNASMSLAKPNAGSGCLVMIFALAPVCIGLAYVLGNVFV